MKKINRDICEGPIFKSLIRYIIPLMLTNLIQVFYISADNIIAGVFCGSAALAAVGSASTIISFLTTLIIGLSTGASVCVAQAVGAKNDEKLKRTVQSILVISFIGGIIIISLCGLLFSKPLLVATNTPKEILDDTVSYLLCAFSAYIFFIPAVFINGILLSIGETKKPMIFSVTTGLTNVFLNLLFSGLLGMGVFGLALATAISQVFSFGLNFWALFGKHSDIKVDWKRPKIDLQIFKEILILGLPTGIQNSVITLSNLIIRATYNSFGVAFLSGYTAAQNVLSVGGMIFSAFIQAASVYAGQNYGAENFARIKKSLSICVVCVAVTGLLFGITTLVFGKELLSLYITDSADALNYGLLTFSLLSLPSLISGVGNCLSGATRGMGVSLPQLFVSLGGAVGLKFLWIYTIFQTPKFHNPAGLLTADPIIWILQTTVVAVIFVVTFRKKVSQKTN
ncbi:MAG: MATE family efflux transporter [Clostridia bacterium]|nr:MATE family efflux transporter [Clostridia bacterium]